jgi:hypothetical protein
MYSLNFLPLQPSIGLAFSLLLFPFFPHFLFPHWRDMFRSTDLVSRHGPWIIRESEWVNGFKEASPLQLFAPGWESREAWQQVAGQWLQRFCGKEEGRLTATHTPPTKWTGTKPLRIRLSPARSKSTDFISLCVYPILETQGNKRTFGIYFGKGQWLSGLWAL